MSKNNTSGTLKSIEQLNRLNANSFRLISNALNTSSRLKLRETTSTIRNSLQNSPHTIRNLKFQKLTKNKLQIQNFVRKVDRYTIQQYLNNYTLKLSKLNKKLNTSDFQAISQIILINNNLKYLFLNKNKIGDTGLKCMTKAIEKNKSIRLLEIDDNQITADGVKVLAKALEKNNSIQSISLSNNNINYKGASMFIKPNSKRSLTNRFLINLTGNNITGIQEQILDKLYGDMYIL